MIHEGRWAGKYEVRSDATVALNKLVEPLQSELRRHIGESVKSINVAHVLTPTVRSPLAGDFAEALLSAPRSHVLFTGLRYLLDGKHDGGSEALVKDFVFLLTQLGTDIVTNSGTGPTVQRVPVDRISKLMPTAEGRTLFAQPGVKRLIRDWRALKESPGSSVSRPWNAADEKATHGFHQWI